MLECGCLGEKGMEYKTEVGRSEGGRRQLKGGKGKGMEREREGEGWRERGWRKGEGEG